NRTCRGDEVDALLAMGGGVFGRIFLSLGLLRRPADDQGVSIHKIASLRLLQAKKLWPSRISRAQALLK
ncbi:MAG: hypothetical protein ACYSTZ_12450, partial [Planctomycetota bacterium]